MAKMSNRTVGLITVIVLLVGAWVVLKFLLNIIWPIVSELWFPAVIIIAVILLFLLFSKKK